MCYFKHGSYIFKGFGVTEREAQIPLEHIKENEISLGVQAHIKPLNNLKGT